MPYTYLRGVAGDDSVDFVAAPAPGVMFAAGDGNDTVLGSGFADRLNGGAGADSLIGRAGSDVLADGTGQDVLCGGDRSFNPAGLNNTTILARLGGGSDGYILVNDGGSQDIVFGFDGIGGRGAGPQDFLWLKGYATGSTLVFDQYRGRASAATRPGRSGRARSTTRSRTPAGTCRITSSCKATPKPRARRTGPWPPATTAG